MISIKIANDVTNKASRKLKTVENETEIPRETYISPERRQNIIDDL